MLALVGVLGLSACASDTVSDTVPTVSDVTATGRELATRFVTILKDEDSAALEEFLDPAFQLQRAFAHLAFQHDGGLEQREGAALEVHRPFHPVHQTRLSIIRCSMSERCASTASTVMAASPLTIPTAMAR